MQTLENIKRTLPRQTAELRQVTIPFESRIRWIIVLNGDLFGSYRTLANAKRDAREFRLRLRRVD